MVPDGKRRETKVRMSMREVRGAHQDRRWRQRSFKAARRRGLKAVWSMVVRSWGGRRPKSEARKGRGRGGDALVGRNRRRGSTKREWRWLRCFSARHEEDVGTGEVQ